VVGPDHDGPTIGAYNTSYSRPREHSSSTEDLRDLGRYWPKVTDESDLIALALNRQPKYVASATLRKPTGRETTSSGRRRRGPRIQKPARKADLRHGQLGTGPDADGSQLIDDTSVAAPVSRRVSDFREGGRQAPNALVDSQTSAGAWSPTYGAQNDLLTHIHHVSRLPPRAAARPRRTRERR